MWGIRTNAFLQGLEGHTGEVIALAFSPDGEMLASKSEDQTLRRWDVATGVLKQTIKCHGDGPSAIAFSRDNKTLLLATHTDPILREDSETSEGGSAKHDGYWITHVTLSQDSGIPQTRRDDNMVRLNELTPMNKRRMHSFNVATFAFSLNCRTLASGLKSGLILLWDAETGIHQQTLKGRHDELKVIAFSPDGSKIASACAKNLIRLWDAATGIHLKAFSCQNGIVRAIAFCQDNTTLLVGLAGHPIQLYDTTTGTLVQQTSMSSHDSAIAISPDNKLLASAESIIGLWDATVGMQKGDEIDDLSNASGTIALSPDGTTVASAISYSNDTIVQLWDAATGRGRLILENVSCPFKVKTALEVRTLVFSADGKTLAVASIFEIQLWDAETGACRQTLGSYDGGVSNMVFSPDGSRLAVVLSIGKVMLLDMATGGCLWETKLRDWAEPKSLAFSPNSSMLAALYHMPVSEDVVGEIDLWNTRSGSLQQEFAVELPNKEMCTSIIFSMDGQSLYLNHQYTVSVSQPNAEILQLNGELRNTLQNQCVPITDGWITKDGRRLLWVPMEYRTLGAFMHGNTVVLGHELGPTFVWLDL